MPEDGDLVELHFHGTLDDGSVFDSSRGRSSRYFVIGRAQLIAGFERAVCSMRPGAAVRIRLEPDEAYGEHEPSLVFEARRDEVDADAHIGDEVALTGGRPARIVALTPTSVLVDANHPLAGLALNFEIDLLSVRPTESGARESRSDS